MIGLSLAQAWLDQGAPQQITLAELGPGRGTLMADALRATKAVAGFHAALQVHFVETSPSLRAKQAAAVPDAQWHNDVSTLPDAPLFLIANEFFDALPIRQFTRDAAGWREHMVAVVDGKLTYGLSDAAPLGALDHRLVDTKAGDVVEICPALPAIAGHIAGIIDAQGGAAIIIDYGDWQSQGDTLQAMANHAPTDPFADPGQADLTAHVDFAAIAAAGTHTCGFGSDDQHDIVAINRARVAQAMGGTADDMVGVHQIHSADVATMTQARPEKPKADAVVTATKGVILSVLTADCQPVLFADQSAGVIGAAHAGWQGALSGVLDNTVDAMVTLGAVRENITAVIGPSISQRNYEVGPEFAERFMDEDPAFSRFFAQGHGDRMQFDLCAFGLDRLRAAGIADAAWTRHCTYDDPARFFSYRRSSKCHGNVACAAKP